MGYKAAKNKLRADTGQKFWRNLELAIRQKEATKGEYPVLAKLWYFWGNHFTISDKDSLANYTTGAYKIQSIRANLNKTFEEVAGYDEMIIIKDIRLESHCEHHMVPILGKAHLAYIPNNRVVGISKLARVVDVYGKRLQTQETMTQQIANCIEKSLKPKGVAVYIEALHQCMTTRGVQKPNVSTITSCFLGEFKTDKSLDYTFKLKSVGATINSIFLSITDFTQSIPKYCLSPKFIN